MIARSLFSLRSATPRARLATGIAISLVLHAIVIGMMHPRFGAPPRAASPLTVFLSESMPTAQRAPLNLSERPTPARVASIQTSDTREALPPSPPHHSVLSLEVPLERYFRASEVDVRARQINEVDLLYPKRAYEMRISGKVLLRLFINERGTIDSISILDATPAGTFEESAVAATAALRFAPAALRGNPVKSQKTIEVTFDPYSSINTP